MAAAQRAFQFGPVSRNLEYLLELKFLERARLLACAMTIAFAVVFCRFFPVCFGRPPTHREREAHY